MDLTLRKWLSDDKIVKETVATLESKYPERRTCILTNGTSSDIGILSNKIKIELEKKGRVVIQVQAEEYRRNGIVDDHRYILIADPNCHFREPRTKDSFYIIDVDRCYSGY